MQRLWSVLFLLSLAVSGAGAWAQDRGTSTSSSSLSPVPAAPSISLPATSGNPAVAPRGPADAPTSTPRITNREQPAAEQSKGGRNPQSGAPSAPGPGTSASAAVVSATDAPNEFQEFIATSTGRFLPLFGYNLFAGAPSTFAPVDRIPVTPDYVVGPGDEILIRAWGQVDIDYRAVVDRNGTIHIPHVGTLTVGGLRYQDLHGFIRNAVARIFRNFELTVNLGELRSIQIFVVGQAKRPGAYTVSSLSTLVNALFASGGPSTKGSMRLIQLKRNDKVVTEFDVYDLLLKGDKSKDVRLLPGDVIYIPPIGRLVAISGSVNEPAIYELKNGASLGELIQLAGGLSTIAAGQKATVERIVDRRARRVADFPLDTAGLARPLQDGDLVQIYALSPRFENAVTLRGAVASAGRFPWREGLRVRDIIPDREALIVPDYWEKQNQAFRSSVGRLPPARASDIPDPRFRGEGEQRFRTELRRTFDEINWDYAVVERLNYDDLTTALIPFNLGRAVLDGDPTHNLQLRPGDVVTIFSKADIQVPVAKQTQFVRIEGELVTPGVYQILPGETLRQLLVRIGGVTPNSYLYGAEFTRESVRIQQQKRLDEALDRLSQEIERSAASRATSGLDTDKEGAARAAENQRRLLARLREVRATGRIVLDIPPDGARLASVPDMPLEDGDRLVVPAKPSTVSVVGAVYNQNTFLYDRGKRVGDYLQQAGGTTRDADSGRVYVVKADGSVAGRAQGVFPMYSGERLMPGDTIVVPETLERFNLTRELKDWSQIFYQFALGVAGLKVLRDL